MALFSEFVKRLSAGKNQQILSFPSIIKNKARSGEESYSTWIRNHRWNERNEFWCRKQIENFSYRPTISILMQSKDAREEFLHESLASIFNQVYPFHEFFVMDRGSRDPQIKRHLERILNDSRVKVSFQKGAEKELSAVAKIMKKTESEWILLMNAEDILEPYTLYNLIAALQDTVEIDFVYADSDLIDDQGLRFAPQFKPVWAVGARYPLGYFQHPILLSERLVEKLKGYERVSTLAEEGGLLDEASNHSRYAIQAPGVLYHARTKGAKNEIPPESEFSVLTNENLIHLNEKIEIDPEIRIRSEPEIALQILMILDSFEDSESLRMLFQFARYLKQERGHTFHFLSLKEGVLRKLYEQLGPVKVLKEKPVDLEESVKKLQSQSAFDVGLISTGGDSNVPEVLHRLNLPHVWQIRDEVESDPLKNSFGFSETIVFSSPTISVHYKELDQRGVSRIVSPAADFAAIKLFIQRNSPFELRKNEAIEKDATVVTVLGPTIVAKGQKTFLEAALKLLATINDRDLRFFLIGSRPGSYLNELKQTLDENKQVSRFHFVPESWDGSDYYNYYLISDICVSCSSKENFPLAILESMAFKKAVIGTDVFSINEIIEHSQNGYLVKPNYPTELSDRLRELIENQATREQFGRKSLELARERFHVHKMGIRLERFLRESIVFL